MKRKFLTVNFGGKKLAQVTLYARTVFTNVMRVNIEVFHGIL